MRGRGKVRSVASAVTTEDPSVTSGFSTFRQRSGALLVLGREAKEEYKARRGVLIQMLKSTAENSGCCRELSCACRLGKTRWLLQGDTCGGGKGFVDIQVSSSDCQLGCRGT